MSGWRDKAAERKRAREARWEARRAGPPPPRRTYRAVITLVLMAALLALFLLMVFNQPSTP